MHRFHQLVDRELDGAITAAESAELAQIRESLDQLDAPRIAQMREKFALQDKAFQDAVNLFQSSRKPAATKTMKAGR